MQTVTYVNQTVYICNNYFVVVVFVYVLSIFFFLGGGGGGGGRGVLYIHVAISYVFMLSLQAWETWQSLATGHYSCVTI